MPCEDQTEYIEFLLDEEDRLEDFLLRKKTCGRPVGDTTLTPFVKGMTLEQLLAQELAQRIPHLQEMELTDEFLMFKQYYSLRAAASVILGLETGGLAESFVMDEMIISADKAKYAGYVAVDVISEEIEACGKCRGCATRRRRKSA